MGKGKLAHFEEMKGFELVVQPKIEEVLNREYKFKGKWASDFFKNNNPVVLELGCGKGEYTVGLARLFPEKNFLGIDIKGARIWRGAKTANDEKISNVGFLRAKIELTQSFFAENEISEIWITFPDPHLKNRRSRKRLTSSRFLMNYQKFLISEGIIHLKTDSDQLYNYTSRLLDYNKITPVFSTNDLYNNGNSDHILSIKTHYENLFLKEGQNINYLKFSLNGIKNLEEPGNDE